jgi:hypothetical protein
MTRHHDLDHARHTPDFNTRHLLQTVLQHQALGTARVRRVNDGFCLYTYDELLLSALVCGTEKPSSLWRPWGQISTHCA